MGPRSHIITTNVSYALLLDGALLKCVNVTCRSREYL